MTIILLSSGIFFVAGFVIGTIMGFLQGRRKYRPKCYQCGEPAFSILGSTLLCDGHYREFRKQFPGPGEE